jgi:hypothetical protein
MFYNFWWHGYWGVKIFCKNFINCHGSKNAPYFVNSAKAPFQSCGGGSFWKPRIRVS